MGCGIHNYDGNFMACHIQHKVSIQKDGAEAYGQNSKIRAFKFSVLFSLANMVTYSKQFTEDCNPFE